MKLVSVHSHTVVDLPDASLPPYCVLSHTQDNSEQDAYSRRGSNYHNSALRHHTDTPAHYSTEPPPSYTDSVPALANEKLVQACALALQSGVHYIWIDALCIDRSSTVDLDDAVNGSRRRLRNSDVCVAYLHDLPPEVSLDRDSAWAGCRYWKRAWTLQELILAPRVKFYDRQWNYRGDKDELSPLLSDITRIPRSVLLDSTMLSEIALAVRISWSVGRLAGREEDTVYALVAITETTLPVRYGEGAERAFQRLQEELLRDTRDGSLLAWRSAREDEVRGLLARSPSEFGHFAPTSVKEPQRPWVFNGKVRFSSKGVELESRVCKGPGCVLLSIGQKRQDVGTASNIVICFREWNGVYVRVAPASRVSSSVLKSWRAIDVVRDVDDRDSLTLRSLFNSMPCRLDLARRGGYHEARRRELVPRVVKDNEEVIEESWDQDQDTEMSIDENHLYLTSTPTKTRTPSDHSEGSYVQVGAAPLQAGAWTEQLPVDDETDESDQYSLSFSVGSVSVSASDSESESGYPIGVHVSDPLDSVEHEDDAAVTETRSVTTLAADQDDRNSLKHLIMRPKIRAKVLQTSYDRLRRWIPTVRYVTPPQDRLPLRSRINTTAWFAEPESLTLLSASNSREQNVSVFRPDGYLHLACPFFAADPAQHRSCVLRGKDLQNIPGVLRHIRDHHPIRAYCARCFLQFDTPRARDAHMLRQECELVDGPGPQGTPSRAGVSEDEVRRLHKMDLHFQHESEMERWRRIYWELFPALWYDEEDYQEEIMAVDDDGDLDADADAGVAADGSADGDDHVEADADAALVSVEDTGLADDDVDPYLRNGNGFAVSLAHDFWTQYKRECVASALKDCGHDLDELDDNAALTALYQTTLDEIIDKVYHEYHLVN